MSRKNNRIDPELRKYTEQMRNEFAKELGVFDKLQNDPGSLTAREAGFLGGSVTKSLVNLGIEALRTNGVPQNVQEIRDKH